MKKFFVIALALALTAGAAYANYCARDFVPAASLLVPYAVVDMAGSQPDPSGFTTILTVTNVSNEAQLIHVTVWSPLSFPVVDFDEILSGYDVWTINFRDLLTGHFDFFDTEGTTGFWTTSNPAQPVPPYGPTTNRPYTTELPPPWDTDQVQGIDGNISEGPLVRGDVNTADSCYFPYGYHPEYGAGIISALRADIFEVLAQFDCDLELVAVPPWQQNLTDDPLFFYVTVDTVDRCSLQFPSSNGYWTGGVIPDEDNVLLGEMYYLDPTANRSEAMAAVHLEYDIDTPDSSIWTFWELQNYGPGDWNIYDGLEPLGTAFAFRYYNSGGISSELLVWKSHWEFFYDDAPFYVYPYVYACGPYIYYAWDENEKSKARGGGPSGFLVGEPDVIPFETQAVPLDSLNWSGLMANNGWMLLVFEPSIYDFPDTWWWVTQAWVGVRHYWGTYSAGLEAATMANYWCFPAQTINGPYFYLNVNYDYDDGNPPYFF